jgi:hypothetical protein
MLPGNKSAIPGAENTHSALILRTIRNIPQLPTSQEGNKNFFFAQLRKVINSQQLSTLQFFNNTITTVSQYAVKWVNMSVNIGHHEIITKSSTI